MNLCMPENKSKAHNVVWLLTWNLSTWKAYTVATFYSCFWSELRLWKNNNYEYEVEDEYENMNKTKNLIFG